MELSISQLSDLTSFDRATIRKRLSGLEPTRKEARLTTYSSEAALPLLYGKGADHDETNTVIQMAKDEARKMRAEAQIKEIQAARDAGEVITIDEVVEVVGAEYTAIRAILVAIPTKLCQELAMLDDVAQVKAKLDDAINEALTEMSGDLKYYAELNNLSSEANADVSNNRVQVADRSPLGTTSENPETPPDSEPS